MTVTIDNDTALEMLMERVKFWTNDDDYIYLFTKLYRRKIDSGYFDNKKFDVKDIVDNDFVNNYAKGTMNDIRKDYGYLDERRIGAIKDDTDILVLYEKRR